MIKLLKFIKKAITKAKVIPIKDDNLLEYINEYINKSHLYNTIMNLILNELKDPEEEMITIMKDNGIMNRKGEVDFVRLISFMSKTLADFGWTAYPNRMLLILDDFAAHPLLKRKDSELPSFLRKLRHFYINVLICVQNPVLIPRDLKRDMKDCIVFPGISEEDFNDFVIHSKVGKLGTSNELWEKYRKIKDDRTMIIFHIKAKDIIVVPPK